MRSFVAAAVASCTLAAAAQAQEWGHPYHEQINSLMERSPSFKTEVASIMDRVIVNTNESLPGEHLVLLVPSGDVAALYFDVKKIERLRLTDQEFDVILVHELYGHAVPELRDDRVCRDPEPGQMYMQSCVGRREAKVLRELGMRPRTKYTLR